MRRYRTKLAVLFAAAAMSASVFGGCWTSGSGETKAISGTSAGGSAEETTTQGAEGESAASAEETEAHAGDTTVPEQVLMDASGVRITATGYEKDGLYGDALKLLIENNGSADVGVGADAVIVNDYMVNTVFSEKVAAGKKLNGTLDLYSSELEESGIDNVGQIEVYFKLFDPSTYETTFTAEPCVIQTNHYSEMDTTPNDDGQELYNANGVRIVGKYVKDDTFWGNAIVLYLENNTDQNLTIQCDDLSVNGYMMSPLFSSTVYAGKKSFDDITLLDDELRQNGITDIQNVELKFRILSAADFSQIAETDAISFSVGG